MRVQKLALAVGLVSALGSNAALALGLGEIKLNSTLNQPLDAEIKLLQTRGLTESEVKVRLASSEDFERAGVDRGYGLNDLRFEVDYSGSEPVVRISSRTPIREPFLNFLVETRWPSGRLLREYTLLMDLPAFSTNTASQPVRAAERERQQVRREAPVQRPLQPTIQQPSQRPEPTPVEPAAETAQQQPAPSAEPEATSLPAESYAEPSAPADSGSRVYGPVEANNTLWEIARDTRESSDLSVHQSMLAIQRLNPEAFIDNNINLLKKGAVLRLPSADDVRAMSLNEAVTQVATQNDAWRERVGDAASDAMGAPLDGRVAEADSAVSENPEGRVSLAAPGDNESVLSGSGSGAGDSEALAGELVATEEELDKSRLEGAELEDRIGELNEQIDTMERMVEVSNEELRAVQDAATETNEAEASEIDAGSDALADPLAEDGGESQGEEASITADGEAEVEGADVESTGVESASDSASETVDSATTVEEVAPEPVVEEDNSRNRVVVTRSEPTLVDQLMENIHLIGIGAAALLAAVFGFFTWRRRKEEEEAIRQVEAEMAAETAVADEPDFEESEDHLSAVEEFETSETLDLDQLGEVETDDPVGEAEIHLSLGQYQEAEAKLLKGLEAAPSNIDARLMLLEAYAQQQDVSRFDDHYRQLLGFSDGPAADRAARLRETIAGAGTFELPDIDYSSESLEAAQLDDLGGDDYSASFEDLDEFSTRNSESGEQTVSGDDTSLLDDLELDLDAEPEAATQSGAGAQSGDDLELDLDLGGDLDLGDGLDSEWSSDSANGIELDDAQDVTQIQSPESDTAVSSGDGDDFNFDEFSSGGELDLDLDSLDLDGGLEPQGESSGQSDDSASVEFELDMEPQADTASSDESGLEFDLDLTPMEEDQSSQVDAQPADTDSASMQSGDDDLESFGDDLGELDLDSIDLGEFELEGDSGVDGGQQEASAPTHSASEQASDDVAVAEAPAKSESASQSQAALDDDDLGFDLEGDLDSELNLLEGGDEVSTKLELAQAYLDMGDKDGAREILGEVAEEASGEPQQRAREMLERMS